MNFSNYINKKIILQNVKPNTKENILRQISDSAVKIDALQNSKEEIYKLLQERENLGSTGFSKGLAIPHCKLKNIDTFYIGVITIPNGTDFNALDNQLTKLIIFIIAPESKRNEHIHILSSISRAFNSLQNINKIISYKNGDELYNDLIKTKEEEHKSKSLIEYCNINIYIQDENKFKDVLEVLSGFSKCSLSVIEANNSGHYLNSLPLFASFWNEDQKQSQKIISAVIDKSYSNEIIRQIQDIQDVNKKTGIMITLNDLLYKNGDLNL